MDGGNLWTGSTVHFIARGIGRGPPMRQEETTEVKAGMGSKDVRRENYFYEGANLWQALTACLSDPDVAMLLWERRKAGQLKGAGEAAVGRASGMARSLLAKYQEAFDSHWARRKEEGLGTGRYSYRAPFGANSPSRSRVPQDVSPTKGKGTRS